jgi:hypothetical protein
VEERGTVVVPGYEVVGVAPVEWCVAAGEDAAAVAGFEGSALVGGGVSEQVGDTQGFDGAVFGDAGEEGRDSSGTQEAFDG